MTAPVTEESRPGGGGSLDTTQAATSVPTVPADSDEPATAQRRAWARRMIIAAGGPIPRYGSRAWHRLPETNRARVAAVVIAAEAWAHEIETTAERLHLEITEGRAEQERHDAEEFAAMAAGVRRLASVPTFAEVCDRRGDHVRADRARAHAAAMREGWSS